MMKMAQISSRFSLDKRLKYYYYYYYIAICFTLFSIIKLSQRSTSIECLNIDTRYPVHFRHPRSGSAAISNDSPLFGHSVLIVPSSDHSANSITYLIGAPNENVEKIHRGAIYRCRWTPNSIEPDCFSIIDYDLVEQTENMHIGFNLLLQPKPAQRNEIEIESSQRYVSCAFSRTFNSTRTDERRNNAEKTINPIGTCYQFDAAKRVPISSIEPLKDSSKQFLDANETEYDRSYYYSHSMAGFSAVFSLNGDRLFLGTPGFDNWRGNLLRIPSKNQIFMPENEFVFDLNSLEHDSYMGYAISLGKFFREGNESIALGAPRSSLTGWVALISAVNEKSTKLESTISGTQIGSYFGSSLLAVDVNSDGFDDLLIGAPMYSCLKRGFSDEGRVYVFLSDGQKLLRSTILDGPGKPDSRFGTAMASLGDINNDGFNDVVIGAPYEDELTGAIYVYRGSLEGLSNNYSQRISAAELPLPNLSGFGYSFSTQVDVDENRYNDLLVGSYLSNSAILLRTRPIASLQAWLEKSDNYFDLNQTCFALENLPEIRQQLKYRPACVKIRFCVDTQNFDDAYQNSMLNATLLVDASFSEPQKRCVVTSLEQEDDNRQSIISGSKIQNVIRLNKSTTPICSPHFVIITKEKSQIENYLDPIVFSLSYDVHYANMDRLNFFQLPIVEGATSNISTAVHLKMCESIARNCVADLRQNSSIILNADQADDAYLEFSDFNQTKPIEVELIQGRHRKVKLKVAIDNRAESAFSAKLNITLNGTLSLIKLDSRCQYFERANLSANSSVQCNLKNPFTKSTQIEIDFNAFDSIATIRFVIQTTLANKLTSNSVVREEILFRSTKRVAIDIKINEQQSLIRYKLGSAANVSFESVVQIDRKSFSPIEQIKLKFIYLASYKGTRLLNPFQLTNMNNRISVICENSSSNIGVERIGLKEKATNVAPIKLINSTQQILSLDCSSTNSICETIACDVASIAENETVYVKFASALRSETIDRHFGSNFVFDQIVLGVRVNASILDTDAIAESQADLAKTELVRFAFNPVLPIRADEPTPIWPYALGVLIGLLLIAVLILLLYKCGFFRRNSLQ